MIDRPGIMRYNRDNKREENKIMMTREMVKETLEALGADVDYTENVNGFDVTLQDFDGFDAHWCEIDREYDDEDAVDAFLDMLETGCVSQDGDFYTIYHFEDFDVQLGYASFDI